MIEAFLNMKLIFGLTMLHVVMAGIGIYAAWMIKVALLGAEEGQDDEQG